MKIAVIGIGGVGGYFGGKLAAAIEKKPEHKIYFVARGKHGEEIRKNGLILKTAEEGTIVCKPTETFYLVKDLPKSDVYFICVKQYDLDEVLIQLQSKIDDSSIIIPLLNGIDIYERIRHRISKGLVFPACVYVGTHIAKPGVVEQAGGACQIIFGTDKKIKSDKPALLCELMENAKINYLWTENHLQKIWEKFLFIAAYAMVCASENKTIGEVYQNPTLKEKTKQIIEEIILVGKAENIVFSENIIEQTLDKALTFPHNTKTSFQRDIEAGRNDERDLFINAIIRLAEKNGINAQSVKKIKLPD